MRKDRLAPLTGVAFIAMLIVTAVVMGEPPEADEGADKVVDFYVDNKDEVMVGAFLSTIAALLLVFFANHLRTVFHDPTGSNSLSATVLVGAAIVAVAAAIDSTIAFAIAEAAEDIDPTSVQALQALWDNDFLPFILGVIIFMISVGGSTLRTGALPRWLGWAALAFVVVGVTPIGWIAAIGAGLWILVVSVLLFLRSGSSSPPAAAPPTTAA